MGVKLFGTMWISTHALREEGDAVHGRCLHHRRNFYPRPPRGGRPDAAAAARCGNRFLPTPSARRATSTITASPPGAEISTHALREEGDQGEAVADRHHDISTHALREEGDELGILPRFGQPHFYPRPPRGGRPQPAPGDRGRHPISTHALREEGDPERRIALIDEVLFLPTPSARRATARDVAKLLRRIAISTHALREEGDPSTPGPGSRRIKFLPTPSARRATDSQSRKGTRGLYFYPRPPRGGRRTDGQYYAITAEFLPTPSARRATPTVASAGTDTIEFLPTPSARRATTDISTPFDAAPISTHALREEGDL